MDLPVNYSKLSPADRRSVRMEYVKLQDGKCYYCHNSLSGEATERVMKRGLIRNYFPVLSLVGLCIYIMTTLLE